MGIEDEIRSLKRRVDDLEGAVNVLAGQFGKVNPELAALRESTARRLDTIEGLVGNVATSLQSMNTQVWSLRDDLPHLMAEAMRKSKD